MPVLDNPRWELLCRYRAEGYMIAESYHLAGYKQTTTASAISMGSAILRKPPVKKRLRELLDENAENRITTRESVAAELDAAAEQATALDQPSVRVAAATQKAKLFGLEAPKTNLNLNYTFGSLTDDELTYELVSMLNEIRQAEGKQPIALPAPVKREDDNDR
jgi:hypothetical protein